MLVFDLFYFIQCNTYYTERRTVVYWHRSTLWDDVSRHSTLTQYQSFSCACIFTSSFEPATSCISSWLQCMRVTKGGCNDRETAGSPR